ncbi:MAG: phosphatase PAP2 family protein, partial [Patescibacteria group bacterium]
HQFTDNSNKDVDALYYSVTIDQSFFLAFYNFAGHGSAGDFLIVFFGKYFLYVALFVFAYFAYQSWRKGNIPKLYPYAIAILSAIIARFGIASFIRFFYHRPRPFLALGLPHLITDNAYSFPSGHTIFLFALATATYFFNKKLAYFLYFSGAVIGFARVAGGVHYPSDILGGAVLGALTGFVVYKSWEKYFL